MITLKNCTLVLPERIAKGYVVIEEGIIKEVGFGQCPYDGEDFSGDYLVPGYVDVHVHGGGGAVFDLSDLDACQRAADFHFEHGTTTMLMGAQGGVTVAQKYLPIKQLPKNVVGIFMEGPFLNPKRPGAIDPKFITPADLEGLEEFLKGADSQVLYMAVAPEIEKAEEIVSILRKYGVVVSAGHTLATIEQLYESTSWGISSICHTFNGMTTMHHREPGVVGAALALDEVYTEVIADGIHIHKEIVKLLFKVKPHDKVIAITDSVSLNGMPDGVYGRRMINGKLITLTDGTTIAGSTLTMDEAVKNMVSWGIDIVSVIRSATLNPARALGLSDRGSITKGLRADLLRLDRDLNILNIYLKGVKTN